MDTDPIFLCEDAPVALGTAAVRWLFANRGPAVLRSAASSSTGALVRRRDVTGRRSAGTMATLAG